jgi:HK97 family phage major capsid protein
MPELKDVLDDVQREVKAFGENVKGLKDSVERDIAAVRKIAEEAGTKGNDQIKSDLKALSEGVAAKHGALEQLVGGLEEKTKKAIAERMDEVERKMNRVQLMGSTSLTGAEAIEAKSVQHFHMCALAAKGLLKPGVDLSDDKINVEEIKSYGANMPTYLRRGDRDALFDQKAMSVGSDPDGGYFVTPFMSPRILSIVYETSPMRELCNVETISTDAIEYPVDDGEAGAGWVGEQETRATTDTPQVGVQRIPVHEMYAKPKATQKLLEDAAVNIEAWLAGKIGQRFGRLEATAFVAGDGVKKPRGFLTYATGTTRGSIEQVVSGHATLLTFDGLINLMSALKEEYAAGASFLMKRASVGAVLLLKDGNGQYIWRSTTRPASRRCCSAIPSTRRPTWRRSGRARCPVAFGNFKQAYTIVDRLGISTLRDPYSAKPFVEFYTRKRVGGDVTNFEAIKIQKVSA